MAGSERCMIYKTGPTIRPPVVKNRRPSTPLCGNCCKTELYCQAVRDSPEPRTCCTACEHRNLPPDIR